jgi:hypothetical protein
MARDAAHGKCVGFDRLAGFALQIQRDQVTLIQAVETGLRAGSGFLNTAISG